MMSWLYKKISVFVMHGSTHTVDAFWVTYELQWTLFGCNQKASPAVTCDVKILYVLDALDAPGRSRRFLGTPLFDIRKSLKFQKTIT